MAGSMNLIAKTCFPKTEIVTDIIHVFWARKTRVLF